MRLADGPTTEVEVYIDAPADVVWSYASDIDLPARFSSELTGARWLDGATAPALGARFTGSSHHDAVGDWETTCVVTVWEPGRSFAWAVGDPTNPAAVWRFDLTPEGTGVRLRQWAQLGPGPLGPDAGDRGDARQGGTHHRPAALRAPSEHGSDCRRHQVRCRGGLDVTLRDRRQCCAPRRALGRLRGGGRAPGSALGVGARVLGLRRAHAARLPRRAHRADRGSARRSRSSGPAALRCSRCRRCRCSSSPADASSSGSARADLR